MKTFTIYSATETGREMIAQISAREEPGCWMGVIEGFLGGHVSAGVFPTGELIVVEDEHGHIANYTRFENVEQARAALDALAA